MGGEGHDASRQPARRGPLRSRAPHTSTSHSDFGRVTRPERLHRSNYHRCLHRTAPSRPGRFWMPHLPMSRHPAAGILGGFFLAVEQLAEIQGSFRVRCPPHLLQYQRKVPFAAVRATETTGPYSVCPRIHNDLIVGD